VAGLVLGNTWLWPLDRRQRAFGRLMSSPPLQWAILKRNFFVERVLPSGTSRRLSPSEMEHYRRAQPAPEARAGVAEFPRQLAAATPWLAQLERAVGRELGAKRVLITYPMRDFFLPADRVLPRLRRAFSDVEVVELERAKHYFVEDAPREVAAAIAGRFP